MSYATLADLALSGLPAAVLAEVPTNVQQAMLDGASSDIDRIASPKYKAPLSAVTPDIKQWVCEIASWKIMVYRGYMPEAQRDPFKERAMEAMKSARMAVADGTLGATLDATADIEEGAPIFDSDVSRGWGD